MFAGLLERLRPAPAKEVLPLAAALERLDITPFARESVERYKAAKLEDAFLKVLPQTSAGMPINWMRYEGDLTASTFVDPYGVMKALVEQHKGWEVRFYYASNPRLRRMSYLICAKWNRKEMSAADLANASLNSSIPEYVLRKAEQVKAEIPGVIVETDTLETNVRDCDPFLIVRHEQEEYYIEVWGGDEREFAR